MYLNTKDLVVKILDRNILVSTLAKQELLNRDLSNLDISDQILEKVIDKLSIEDLWELKNSQEENHFMELVYLKLNKILDYYQSLNKEEFLKKRNEGKIYLLNK